MIFLHVSLCSFSTLVTFRLAFELCLYLGNGVGVVVKVLALYLERSQSRSAGYRATKARLDWSSVLSTRS